jgi:pimeloyl-ACP methyl ester carboxylesterase
MKRAGTRAAFSLWLVLAGRVAAEEAHVPGGEERLHVVDAGAGEPVVLVPGLLGSTFGFRKLADRLTAGGYRVIVVEPLGFGGSGRPEAADYSLTAQADRIAAVLEARAVGPAVVVAHAVGASMALRLACRHPERVRAVVSLDGGPAESAATPGLRRALRFAFLLKLFGGDGHIRKTVRNTLRERSADPAWVTEEVVDGYLAGGGGSAGETLRVLRSMARAREPEALAPRLGQVRCPVRLLVGDLPPPARGISEAEIDALAAGLAHFTRETVPRAGHFLFEEVPDAVVAAVEQALASARAGEVAAAGRGR